MPDAPPPFDAPLIGPAVARLDGRAKVSGSARFAADVPAPGLLHGVPVGSAVAAGRLRALDTAAARAVPGVVDVLTHADMPRLSEVTGEGGRPGQRRMVMQGSEIDYAGQYVALVVAEDLGAAQAAAALVRAEYEPTTPRAAFEAHLGDAYLAPRIPLGGNPPVESARGDADAALADAPVRIEQSYRTPVQHHVPMEPHATTAYWDGRALLVRDSTQWVYGARSVLAAQLGLPEARIRVICPTTGGAFGSKGSTWPHVTLAAVAALRLGRPVRVVVPRDLGFAGHGHRAPTLSRVALGAGTDGVLRAIVHEATAHTSLHDDFCDATAVMTRSLYACPAVRTAHRLVRVNVNAPAAMRAPGEAPGLFALESAMDELASALALDPLALRLRNHAGTDGHDGRPFSSKALRECYRQGAARFGWASRPPAPRARREGDWLVGQGMASAIYPGKQSPASARVRLLADGSAEAASATHELGTGGPTAMMLVAAAALGLPAARVSFRHGDTELPRAPISAGSQTTACVGSAVHLAAAEAMRRLCALAAADPASPLHGADPAAMEARGGRVALRGEPSRGEAWEALLGRGPGVLEAEATWTPPEERTHSVHCHGAHFCEVRVHARTGEVAVTRWTGAFACGRIINARTAHSQLVGAIVWGIGMALHEATLLDPRSARFVNNNLGEYHVPTSADVPAIDAFFVEERDAHADPIGAKNVGEIGICGAAAALANAVHDACGVRARSLPITLDALAAAPA